MKVRAKVPLFAAGRLQKPGDVFEVKEDGFNEKLMEKVDDKAEVTRPVKKRLPEQQLPESGTVVPPTNFIKNESKTFAPGLSTAPKKTTRRKATK